MIQWTYEELRSYVTKDLTKSYTYDVVRYAIRKVQLQEITEKYIDSRTDMGLYQ